MAHSSVDAIDQAVRSNLPCVLTESIRVSVKQKGSHPLDVFVHAPYEEKFPDLFDGVLDVHINHVQQETP